MSRRCYKVIVIGFSGCLSRKECCDLRCVIAWGSTEWQCWSLKIMCVNESERVQSVSGSRHVVPKLFLTVD